MGLFAPKAALGGSRLPALTGLAVAAAMLIGWPGAKARAEDEPAEPKAATNESPSPPTEAQQGTTTPVPATAAAATAKDPAPESTGGSPTPHRRSTASVGIDLNLEGALGWVPERESITGFGRARVGVLVFFEPTDPRQSPLAISTGLTVEASDLSGATLGVQTELIHLSSGFWGQAGAMVDVIAPSPSLMLSIGWSLFGLEVQRRLYDVDRNPASDELNSFGLYAKLRVPISIIMRAF
ncbi:MAG: hypothetical protein DRI90_05290 [Deltaproteobacteria bacterium]|nr:MAG: hypothetical protein DRI90_05290 [Deltaproteobacteria bacterium]